MLIAVALLFLILFAVESKHRYLFSCGCTVAATLLLTVDPDVRNDHGKCKKMQTSVTAYVCASASWQNCICAVL